MARGTKISEFIKAISAQLEGKEWELPIIVKNDSNQWENFRISSTDLDEIISDESINIYNTDGSLPVIPDGGQPIERKMTLAGNALNIGDNLIVKGDTVDLGSWLRVNKTTTPVGGLNYKYASILQGTTPHHLIKWYKNNNSSAAAIAIGERAMENTTFTESSTPGSIFWGYLVSASSVITGGNNIIIGREAFIGSTLQANVTSVGAYNGTNTKTYGSLFTSIYGRSTGQFSELEGGNIFGTLSGYTCKGSFLNSFGVQNSQYVNGDRNNCFGTLSLIYVNGSNNNVFGSDSFQNANYSNCNIVGNGLTPTQNGHNIWGDHNSTKADIYGLPTFKGLQQKGNLAVDLAGNSYVKDETKPFKIVTRAERLLMTPNIGDIVYQSDFGTGLYRYDAQSLLGWSFIDSARTLVMVNAMFYEQIEIDDTYAGCNILVSSDSNKAFLLSMTFPIGETVTIFKTSFEGILDISDFTGIFNIMQNDFDPVTPRKIEITRVTTTLFTIVHTNLPNSL